MSEPAEYELGVPFVTTKSNDGPHEDHAYVMGYECGVLDSLLALGSPLMFEQFLHTENVPQIDLIAMKHGYSIDTEPWDEHPDEWTRVTLRKTAA